jgi:hypothetical protein
MCNLRILFLPERRTTQCYHHATLLMSSCLEQQFCEQSGHQRNNPQRTYGYARRFPRTVWDLITEMFEYNGQNGSKDQNHSDDA